MRGKGEGLTGSRMKKTASSGRPCGRRIGRRHPAAVVGEEGSRRRLGVLRPCVGRRRGARVLSGARGLVREARGRRWPRQQQAAAMVALGCVREKEQRRRWGRGSEREGSRGRGGAEEKARGVVVSRRCRRAGWWRGELGRVRRVPPLPTGARRKATGRRRWAGPHSAGPAQELGRLWWAARVRPGRLCSFYFFFFCFVFI